MSSTSVLDYQSIISEKQEYFIRNILPGWQQLRRNTGEFLLGVLNDTNEFYLNQLKKWIKNNYNISIAEQDVCIGIAKGEIREELANRIPASKLSKIHPDNMPIDSHLYKIVSPDTGSVIEKRWPDFTTNEIKHCVTIHGVNTVDNPSSPENKPIKYALAKNYRIEDGFLILLVTGTDKEVRLKITDKLKEEIASS